MARLSSLPRPVVALGVVSLLNDLASEMIYPLLPLFLTAVLGAGTVALGTIEGLAESLNSLLKLASGRVSDRLHRRKGLVVAGYALSSAARPLLAATTAVWQILALRSADRVGKGIRTAPRDALIADATPDDRRGLAYAVQRGMDHVGALLGPLLAAALLAFVSADLRTVFWLAALPAAATVATLVWGVREPRRRDKTGATTGAPGTGAGEGGAATGDPGAGAGKIGVTTGAPSAGAGKIEEVIEERSRGAAASHRAGADPLDDADAVSDADPVRDADRERRRRRVLVAMFVFTLGNSTDAFLLLRASQLGVGVATVPLLWAAFHFSKALWSVPGGVWADASGPRRAIVAGWLVYAVTYLGFAAADSGWHAWALFVLYGLHFGLTEGPERALVASMAAPGRRGLALGAYHLAVGIGALPASLAFGLVWERWGASAAFAMGAMLAIAATLLLLLSPPTNRSGGTRCEDPLAERSYPDDHHLAATARGEGEAPTTRARHLPII